MKKYNNKEYLEYQVTTLGKTHEKIAREINCNINTLIYYIQKYKIKSPKKWQYLNDNYKKEIISRYESNETLKDIAKTYEVSTGTITEVLKLNNIHIKNATEAKYIRDRRFQENTNNNCVNGRIFTLNHDYFKTWSNDMSYILGFIYADGCIKNTYLIIELSNKDLVLLNNIKNKLQYTGDIKLREKTNSSRLTIGSCILTDNLKSLGVMENKTKKIRLPNIPIEYLKDFIRGYFDGDGSISCHMKNQYRVRFTCGNKLFLEDILESMYQNFNIPKVNISKDKRTESCYEICYSTTSSRIFFNYIYSDITCLKCDRKYETFKKVISNNEN